jgi:hypothetical protein
MPTWRERRQIYSSMSEIIGYARVRLENLRFQHPWSVEIKRPDPKRIQKMLKVFRAETCLNCELDNFIDALLPTSCKELLADTPGSDLAMLNHEVYCLYGLHRTFAAREYLDPHEQWWTVRLYRETLPKPCIVKIREKFSHEQKFSDGEIFRKILYYHMIDIQPREEAKWWARLTTTKRDDLKQLLKTNDFEASFGKFILYPGLWDSIQLGSLHRLLTLKCYEVC